MRNELFHDGEIAVQKRAGERESARRNSVGISSRITTAALPFLARQRLLALTIAGDDGYLWTSVWCGQPGFVTSADGQRVSFRRALMSVSPDDPVLNRLAIGREVGMLAIELASRRRLRMNGTIEATSDDEIRIVVRESVPQLPQIHPAAPASTTCPRRQRAQHSVNPDARWTKTVAALVESADTAFVGSLHPNARGGCLTPRRRTGFHPRRRCDDAARGRLSGQRHVHDARQFRGRFTSEPGRGRFRARPGRLLFGLGTRSVLTWRIHSTRPEAPAAIGISPCESGFKSICPAARWQLLDASPFNPSSMPSRK